MLNRLAASLENLLDELKESQVEFATIKSELAVLHNSVQILSKIVRDGDGNMSILTKIALLEQKIDDILKWQDRHQETHQRLKGDIVSLNEDIEELQRQLALIGVKLVNYDKQLDEYDKQLAADERAEQEEVSKQLELAHEERLAVRQLRTERQKFLLKIIAAIIAAIVAFLAGWLSKPHNNEGINQEAPHIQQVK